VKNQPDTDGRRRFHLKTGENRVPPLLMIRRELYCQAKVTGMTKADAYDEAGYGNEDQTRRQKEQSADNLERTPNVKARIKELLEATFDSREAAEEKRKDLVAHEDAMGKVEILQGLRTVFELAIRQPEIKDAETEEVIALGPADNLGAANRALELMGKQEGMFADTKHIIHDDSRTMGKAQLIAAIEKVDAQLAAIGGNAKVIEHTNSQDDV
jgi:hypothetical protein